VARGAVLAEGLAAYDATIMYRLLNEPPALQGLDGPLADLVTACLRKPPADRPALPEVLTRLTAAAPLSRPG
jgi:hypothetical protein